MREAVRLLKKELERDHGVALSARIGVNTGEVVAGERLPAGSLVTGDAVNVAARLEQAATPGDVLIGAETLPAGARRRRSRADRAPRGEGEVRAGPRVPTGRGDGRRTGGAHGGSIRR